MRLVFFGGYSFGKCGKIWKNNCFFGRLPVDWGNTKWVALPGLGSIGCEVSC